MAVDTEHMRRLHQEAAEQLELMRTALEATDHAVGTMRDTLDDMAQDHWNTYQDALHMVALHDDILTSILGKHGMNLRDSDTSADTGHDSLGNRLLLLLLVSALIRRHRRFCDVYGWRGNPLSDYLRESMTMEREHIAELIAMIQDII